MVKDKGIDVNMDSNVISAVWAGGRAVDRAVVDSASSHRSLLVC